ncbi:MAG: nicotinate (nicotinamide) nucleotide adenylyltransferase [Ghiorsea sp.]
MAARAENKQMMPKHIALFGGSFDPPHLGHLALAEAALIQLDIDELWLIPVGIPVHRALSGKASSVQRIKWLAQMFEHDKRVKIIDWEINQDKPTPALDTLSHFKGLFTSITPTWLMGMDSFLDMPNWVGYPQHQNLCNLAVFQRKGHEKSIITDGWNLINAQAYSQKRPVKPGHIVHIEVDLPDISSTDIRQNIEASKSLLPQSTCNAILACYASDLMNQKREDT